MQRHRQWQGGFSLIWGRQQPPGECMRHSTVPAARLLLSGCDRGNRRKQLRRRRLSDKAARLSANFRLVYLLRNNESCAGQDLKLLWFVRKATVGHGSRSTGGPAIPSALGTAMARAAASTTTQHNTTLQGALHCSGPSESQLTHLSPAAKETGARHSLLALPCQFLRKCISHGTSACVVKDKPCNQCIRTKHGIIYKPDSDSF